MGSIVADAFFLVKLVLIKIVRSARTMLAAERGLEGVKVGVLYLPCQQRNHRSPWRNAFGMTLDWYGFFLAEITESGFPQRLPFFFLPYIKLPRGLILTLKLISTGC